MEIYKNEEWRKQIVKAGGEMVAQGKFWIFGTAKYIDGTMIRREKAEKDASRFFNTLDRKLLKRIDYNENRRLERLVFIETGKTRTNIHIHFYIKGNDYVDYEKFIEPCEKIWTEEIEKSYDIQLDNIYDNGVSEYCWKEMNNLNADVLLGKCCHFNFI